MPITGGFNAVDGLAAYDLAKTLLPIAKVDVPSEVMSFIGMGRYPEARLLFKSFIIGKREIMTYI
jgi:hypothetical protein